jgi:hypothetical protein
VTLSFRRIFRYSLLFAVNRCILREGASRSG